MKKIIKIFLSTFSIFIIFTSLVFIFSIIFSQYPSFLNPILKKVNNFKALNTQKYLKKRNLSCYENLDPQDQNLDFNSFIHIQNDQDAQVLRKKIVSYIWKQNSLPNTQPIKIVENIDNPIPHSPNTKQVNEIIASMEYGYSSHIFHFIPKKDNNRLILVHHGHDSNLKNSRFSETIKELLKKGFHIFMFYMPNYGPNYHKYNSHHELYMYYQSDNFCFLKFFLEPVNQSLNYAQKNYNFSDISMIGISGGAWTTTVYSAIDPRIITNFPVAGSLPLPLRYENKCNESIGDIEQILPEFYDFASYLDLYILGSYGKERQKIQILNKYDNCCFFGERYILYEDKVISVLKKLDQGGSFQVFLDDTHYKHQISKHALENAIFPNL